MSTVELPSGVWPAALTPFDDGLAIDVGAFEQHIGQMAEVRHVSAIVVNGHAGEATSLSAVEQRELIGRAKGVTGGGTAIVAGVIADSTDGALTMAVEAAAAGADGLLLFPPSGFRLGVQQRPEMAIEFARAVGDATSLPICLFQYPVSSGIGYSSSTLAAICAEVPTVCAVKESSDYPADYERNLVALAGVGRPIRVLSSNNAWLFASLALGGDGVISGMGSVAAEILAQIYERVLNNDLDQARDAQRSLFRLTEALLKPPAIDAHTRMKVILHQVGVFPTALVRGPLLPVVDPRQVSELCALVDELDLRTVLTGNGE